MKTIHILITLVLFSANSAVFGQFGTKIVIDNTFKPNELYSADVDEDGFKDIISASYDNDQIVWYKNIGYGNFGSRQTITDSVDAPTDIYMADLDNDGIIDLVSASRNDNKIAWYKNFGDGTFGPQQIISSVANTAQSVFAADIDGDNDIDVLSACNLNSKVVWYANDGNGNFGAEQNIANKTMPVSVRAYDIDNDNDLDVIFGSNYDDEVYVYKNNGSGLFSVSQIISNLDGIRQIDTINLNNDGFVDIVIASSNDDKITLYENNGLGSFISPIVVSDEEDGAFTACPVDFNNDGLQDIVTASMLSNKVKTFKNSGSGMFVVEQEFTVNGVPAAITTDIDNDGDADIISISPTDNEVIIFKNYTYGADHVIKGTCYFDENQNGIKDSIEQGLYLINTYLNPTGLANFTDNNGGFIFVTDPGSYTLNYIPIDNWVLTTDFSEYNITLDGDNNFYDSLDFGFYSDTSYIDIYATLTSSTARCDIDAKIWINYFNSGTVRSNAIIEFTLDDSYDHISASVSPDSIIGNKYYWEFDTLNVFSEGSIELLVHTPTFLMMGETVEHEVTILSKTGNDTYHSVILAENITCSYDPNDKRVLSSGNTSDSTIALSDTLEYTIRFQNTGNDTAYDISVADQIDTNLIVHNIEILGSSHQPLNVTVDENRTITFEFPNIMLPDSNANEVESHGFVKFRITIDPTSLPNALIYNTANIFFDNNPAVVTNTVSSRVECYINPIAPSIENTGNILSVTTQYQVQWYLNDSLLSNETNSTLTPTQSGNYTVQVLDENGCFSFSDAFIITNINDIRYLNNRVKIYPNPTTGIINIEGNNINKVDVIDANGSIIISKNPRKIDLTKLKKGIYFIRITTDTSVTLEKIILE